VTTTGVADRQLGGIARGGALNLAGAVIAGAAGVGLTAIVTNAWDARSAGALFSATSVFLILAAAALLGTDTGLARFLLRYEAQGRSADVTTALRVALVPVTLAGLGTGAVLAAAAGPVARWTGLPPHGDVALRVLGVALPLVVLSDACLAATRAFGTMRATVAVDKLLRSGTQLLAVALAGLVGVGLTGLTVAWALPYVLAGLAAPVILLRLTRARALRPHPQPLPARPVAEVRAEFWRYTWLRAVARICQAALQRADIVLVAALRSPAEAALYTAATRFVVLGQLGVQAVQQVLQPRLTELLATGDRAATREVFSMSTAWIVALSWPVYVTCLVAAPLYLRVFGHRYVGEGEVVVVVLAAAMLLAVASGPVDVMLLMSGRSVTSLGNNALALAVDLGLDAVLVPRHGATGAAIGWAAALAVRNLLPFWQVHRSLGMTGLNRAGLIAMGAGLLCFGAPMLLLRVTAGIAPLPAVALLAVETVAYAALLRAARGPMQLALLRRSMRRRGGPGGGPGTAPAARPADRPVDQGRATG